MYMIHTYEYSGNNNVCFATTKKLAKEYMKDKILDAAQYYDGVKSICFGTQRDDNFHNLNSAVMIGEFVVVNEIRVEIIKIKNNDYEGVMV